MTTPADRYRRLSAAFAARVRAVPADRWDSPSPCAGWTALDVVRHVVDTQLMFLRLVGHDPGPLPDAGTDPAGAFGAISAAVQADLDDPERAGAGYDGTLGRTSFAQGIDTFVNFDLVVHSWDLARATGQDDRLNPEDVRRTMAAGRALGDALRGAGVCGPEVEVGPDADEQTRLLAFLGRRR